MPCRNSLDRIRSLLLLVALIEAWSTKRCAVASPALPPAATVSLWSLSLRRSDASKLMTDDVIKETSQLDAAGGNGGSGRMLDVDELDDGRRLQSIITSPSPAGSSGSSQQVELLTGQILVQTPWADEFTREPQIPEPVMKKAVATLAQVQESSVHNVNVSLLSPIVGSVTGEGIADVTFDIIIIPITGATIITGTQTGSIPLIMSASDVVTKFTSRSFQEVESEIKNEMDAVTPPSLWKHKLRSDYSIKVNFAFASPTTGQASSSGSPSPPPEEGSSTPAFVIIGAVVACVSLTAVVGALFYIRWLSTRAREQDGTRRSFLIRDLVRKRTTEMHTDVGGLGGGGGGMMTGTATMDVDGAGGKKKAQRTSQDFASVAGALAHCKGRELLTVPEVISFQQGQAIRRLAQAMVSDIACHNAPVFISYGTGHRECDATGFGPGACYAAAVLKAFHDVGIQCFSGLMIPTGMNWEIFCAQLAGRFTTCKVLLVLQTKALYSSKPCLKEIYAAQKSKIEIIPLAFELDLPKTEQQWPQIKSTDMDGILMLTEVQKDFCQLDSTPGDGQTMLTNPDELDKLVIYVKEFLSDPHAHAKKTPKKNGGPGEGMENGIQPSTLGHMESGGGKRAIGLAAIGSSDPSNGHEGSTAGSVQSTWSGQETSAWALRNLMEPGIDEYSNSHMEDHGARDARPKAGGARNFRKGKKGAAGAAAQRPAPPVQHHDTHAHAHQHHHHHAAPAAARPHTDGGFQIDFTAGAQVAAAGHGHGAHHHAHAAPVRATTTATARKRPKQAAHPHGAPHAIAAPPRPTTHVTPSKTPRRRPKAPQAGGEDF